MSTDHDGEPGTAPGVVLGMLTGMRAVGLDVDSLCAAAGLSISGLASRTEYLQVGEFIPLWRMATEQFGRGTLGLHVGTAMPFGSLVDYLAGTSATLRAGLGQVSRYIALASRHVRWTFGARDDEGLTLFEMRPMYEPATVPPQVREFGVALATSRVREWFDRRPLEVWFSHAPLGPSEEYQQVLGCPVRFERETTGLRFDEAALDSPGSRHDPQLFRLLESHAERLLAETPATTTFRQRVRRIVIRRLREGEPDIVGVAQALSTSERSLQRRLQAEGVSFRDVVDDARHELARLYLGDKTLTVTDVACLLGYSEAAAFTRAFKRWTGRTPSLVRG
jgi:AraC-like DNA-binding protein